MPFCSYVLSFLSFKLIQKKFSRYFFTKLKFFEGNFSISSKLFNAGDINPIAEKLEMKTPQFLDEIKILAAKYILVVWLVVNKRRRIVI